MSADYTKNVSSSSSHNMHHVSSTSSKNGRPPMSSVMPNISLQNMTNWNNLVNMNLGMANMSYPMMRPSVMVKQRKTNFTQREVDALIASVRAHQDTVLFGVAGGPGWAKAWTQVAAAVSAVEGIVRSEGDVRKKWTYLKWEAKNTSKPDRDSTSRAVLQILTSRQNEIAAANQQAAHSSRSLLEELLVPPQPGVAPEGMPSPQQPSASVGHPPIKVEGTQPRDPPQQPPPQPPQQPTPVSAPPPPRERAPPLGLPSPAMIAHSMAQSQPPPRRPPPPQMRAPSPAMASQQTAPPPEVCLRWNSYHSNMQATFPSLLNNEQFVDVTLACEGHSIKCHKVMLSACSSYFEELLSQNPCQHPIVLMKDLRFWEVQALVDFMYRGEVNVTQDKLPSLLAAAEALQIKGLAGPASNSHDDSLRDDYLDPNSPLRRRKRRAMQMPLQDMSQPGMVPLKNPVGRPRIHHPRIAPRPPVAIQPTPSGPGIASPSTPRVPIRVSTPQSAPPTVLRDDGPPSRRMKHSPPPSPEIKIEPLDADLSNDSIDKLQPPYDRDGGESSGGGESSNHDEPVMNLAHDSERYAINNGLRSDGTRDQSDDERNLDDDDEDDERDRGRTIENDNDHEADHDQDHDHDQDQDQDSPHGNEHDQDENDQDQDHDMDQDAVASDDEKEMHSDSEEDGYDDQAPPDSRPGPGPEQAENLADRLLGRL